MRKTVRTCQNEVKALMLKLEEESYNQYRLTLAAMTRHKGNCVGGICEGSREEDLIFGEQQIYKVDQFSNFEEAEQAFELLKQRWVIS